MTERKSKYERKIYLNKTNLTKSYFNVNFEISKCKNLFATECGQDNGSFFGVRMCVWSVFVCVEMKFAWR